MGTTGTTMAMIKVTPRRKIWATGGEDRPRQTGTSHRRMALAAAREEEGARLQTEEEAQ